MNPQGKRRKERERWKHGKDDETFLGAIVRCIRKTLLGPDHKKRQRERHRRSR